MQDPVIHVGIHKTASTFLQERVFPQWTGINYIAPERIRGTKAFNQLCLADDSLYDATAAAALVRSFPEGKLLLSDENFSGRLFGFGGVINRSLIARRLRDLLPEARILVFLRGQPAFIHSTYQQYIKGPAQGVRPFWDFIHESEADAMRPVDEHRYHGWGSRLAPHFVYYHELLKLYHSTFKAVKVLLFEDLVARPEEVLREMEDFIGPTNRLAGKIDWRAKVNASMAPAQLHALRYRNCLRFVRGGLLTSLFRELRTTLDYRLGKSSNADQQAAQSMARWFEANNAAVIRDFPEVGLQRHPAAYPVAPTTGDTVAGRSLGR